MPLDRRFPKDHRFKVEFTNHPPVYIYLDNHGGWNVDTRLATAGLREWIYQSFQNLFEQRFPELYVHNLTGAYDDEILGIFVLHVTLIPDAQNPRIKLRYYDSEETFNVPGRITNGHSLHLDQILDELSK